MNRWLRPGVLMDGVRHLPYMLIFATSFRIPVAPTLHSMNVAVEMQMGTYHIEGANFAPSEF